MKKFPNKHKSITQWTYWEDVVTVLLLLVSHAAECDIFPQLENLYSEHCTVCCVLWTVCLVNCTLNYVLCTVYIVNCTLNYILCTVYIVYCTLNYVNCTLYIVRKRMLWHCFCTLCHKFLHLLLMYTVNRVQFTLYNICFTRALYTVQLTQYVVRKMS